MEAILRSGPFRGLVEGTSEGDQRRVRSTDGGAAVGSRMSSRSPLPPHNPDGGADGNGLGSLSSGTPMSRSPLAAGLLVAVVLAACAPGTAPDEDAVRIQVAVVGEPRTGNPWEAASLADPATRYVQPDPASLYAFVGPTYTLAPFVAVGGDPPAAVADGDRWTVTVTLDPAARWSDGLLVTATDLAFTFQTVRRFSLGGAFASMWPRPRGGNEVGQGGSEAAGVVAVEAVDPGTVRIVFDARPDPGVWPYGVGTAAVFPAHYWEPLVADVGDAADLYALEGVGAPTATGFTLVGHDETTWSLDATDSYWRRGTRTLVYRTGAVETTRRDGSTTSTGGDLGGLIAAEIVEGPLIDGIDYHPYPTAEAAVDALLAGGVEMILAPDGVPRSEYRRLLAASGVEVTVNPRLGFRYLGFDTTAFPTADASFRRALACRVDAAFLSVEVLGGAVEPVETLVPAGLAPWHDPDVEAICTGLTERERFERAVEILAGGGWTWAVRPTWDEANRDVMPVGSGLVGPDGTAVASLALLAPAWDVDPTRAVFAAHIAEWARQLGIPVTVLPVGLTELDSRISAGAGSGTPLWVGGWQIPPFPDHVFGFFTPGDANLTGYSNLDIDEAAAEFTTAPSLAAARDAVRRAESILARDLPYVPLFTETIIEARRAVVGVPFVHVLDGIQRLDGTPTFLTVQR